MTIDQIKKEVTAAIVEAVPEILTPVSCEICGTEDEMLDELTKRPITLADVLLALDKTRYQYSLRPFYKNIIQIEIIGFGVCRWQLYLTAEEQKDEVWRFLHSVLNGK